MAILPQLTDLQLTWIVTRMTVGTDLEACELTGIAGDMVDTWRALPQFTRVLRDVGDADPRDAFRSLSVQLLPKALLAIKALLDSSSSKAQKDGVTLLLKTHGMMIDRPGQTSPELLDELLAHLREPKPLTVVDITPRE